MCDFIQAISYQHVLKVVKSTRNYEQYLVSLVYSELFFEKYKESLADSYHDLKKEFTFISIEHLKTIQHETLSN